MRELRGKKFTHIIIPYSNESKLRKRGSGRTTYSMKHSGKPFYTGIVSADKTVVPDNKQHAEFVIASNPVGSRVIVTIEPFKKARSLEQNAYYWGVVVPPFFAFLKDKGWDISNEYAAHELLKSKFLVGQTINLETGEVWEYLKSSATISTKEFMEYIDKCVQYLNQEFGLDIPLPPQK